MYQNIFFVSKKTQTNKKQKKTKEEKGETKETKKAHTGPVNRNHVKSSQMRNDTPLQL